MKERIQLKTTNIRGKEYVDVNTRIQFFRESGDYDGWSLETEVVDLNDERVVLKAVVRDHSGRIAATGLAHERAGSSQINKTSYIENCETSAWGRALGNLGIGVTSSIASKEEVENAIAQQDHTAPSKASTKIDEETFDINIGDHRNRLVAVSKTFGITGREAFKSLAEKAHLKILIKDLPEFIQSQI